MKIRMLSALAALDYNYAPGDIVETTEAARWIECGIAEAITEKETAATPIAAETAEKKMKKVARKAAEAIVDSEESK